jgi:hypothetical protein
MGEELGSICFVRDYVELHFDGPIVRAISLPNVTLGEKCFLPDSSGWRDALCSLIGRELKEISLDERFLKLIFHSTARVEIQLSPLGPAGEAMHFVPKIDGPMQVW